MSEHHYAGLSQEFNQHIVFLLDALSAVSALAQLASHELSETQLLKQALAALMANQDMERCSIFLVEEDALVCAAGLDWEEMLGDGTSMARAAPRPARRYPLGEGLMGAAAESGALQHCRSCADDPRFKSYAAAPVPGSLLCVPIVCEASVLGVLNVFHPQPDFFDPWHERLLLLYCQSLARLLTNHRLMHQLNAAVDARTAEIRRQQAFVQTVLDSAPEPMMVIDRACRILVANRAAHATAVMPLDQAHCYQASHHRDTPCDGKEHPCPLQQVIATGNTTRVVHEHENAVGEKRLVELHAAPFRDEAGAIVGIIESAHDITEHVRLEEALTAANQRLREAQRIAHLGDWEHDFAAGTIGCSAEMAEICGFPPGAKVRPFADLLAAIHPDDRQDFADDYAMAVRQRRRFEKTHRLQAADGTISYAHTTAETSYADDGRAVRAQGTLQDVTIQTLNELSLRESEERFRTIADYTYDWEYWEGPRGELLYCSPSCERITGYRVTDFVTQPDLIYRIIHPDDRDLMQQHRHDIQHEHFGTLTFRIVRRDGGIRWIAHGCQQAFARDGRFLGRRASNRDITEFIQAQG